jgi:hypothetical protein
MVILFSVLNPGQAPPPDCLVEESLHTWFRLKLVAYGPIICRGGTFYWTSLCAGNCREGTTAAQPDKPAENLTLSGWMRRARCGRIDIFRPAKRQTMTDLFQASYASPIGHILLTATPAALLALQFSEEPLPA